jgi:hypothetical protein
VSALGLALCCLTTPAVPRAQDRDPALAPPTEELDAQAELWRKRRRTGALVLLGSLAGASFVIGWARHRARRKRGEEGSARDPVDKDAPGPPR